MRHISTARSARAPGARDGATGRPTRGSGIPSKWALLDRLAEAREAFGLKDRQVAVLRALLSFVPGDALPRGEAGVVFASNRALSERLHGMPESTLRRHLARLVGAGVIARRDSPNRKRFALRGPEPLRFGLDLAPLVEAEARILAAAEATHRRTTELRGLRMRLRVAIMAAVDAGAAWDGLAEAARLLRRRVECDELRAALRRTEALTPSVPPETAVAAARNECRVQSAQKESEDPAARSKSGELPGTTDGGPTPSDGTDPPPVDRHRDANLPEMLELCAEMTSYATEPIRNWGGFGNLGQSTARMLAICDATWRDCCDQRGSAWAAATVAVVLRRGARVAHPDAYLRALLASGMAGRFDPLTALRS